MNHCGTHLRIKTRICHIPHTTLFIDLAIILITSIRLYSFIQSFDHGSMDHGELYFQHWDSVVSDMVIKSFACKHCIQKLLQKL